MHLAGANLQLPWTCYHDEKRQQDEKRQTGTALPLAVQRVGKQGPISCGLCSEQDTKLGQLVAAFSDPMGVRECGWLAAPP